ncbi:hypothetical protein PPYR_15525, partial [Photinus pyralis]
SPSNRELFHNSGLFLSHRSIYYCAHQPRNYHYEFYNRGKFPHCLGSIDGKHIRIKCPTHSGIMFYNYKQYFSVVLQAKWVRMANKSDGGTFRNSN